jgi:tRNA nucleotidyltransferase (CCA-adding enzyme)
MTHPPARFPAHLALPDEIITIATTLEAAGFETWCVGGALRDHLLGDPQQDVDLATAAPPEAVQHLFRHTVPVGIQHGTVGVLDRHRRLHEVTTFRRDVSTDGRHAVVAYGVSLEDDLARRDFTINALAYHPLRHEWRDPFHGLRDLHDGLVRAVGVPEERFSEDYLRVLRAFRFAARFAFRIEPATWHAIRAAVPGLSGLSAERVRDEWFKGLLSARSVMELVRFWQEAGAAAVLLPELRAAPVIAAPELPPRDPVLLSMLLLHRPDQVLLRLRASSAEVARAGRFVQAPATPAGEDAVAVRHWMHAAGEAVEDLLAAHHRLSGAPATWEGTVAGIRERGDAVSRTGLAVTGHDLAGAGIPPGPAMGRLLDQLLDAVLTDPSLNTREHLLQRARDLA